jgi:hypothetical protein
MDCKNEEHKYDILVRLYALLTVGQSIIFCQVRFLLYCRATSLLTSCTHSTNTPRTESRLE